MALFPEDFEASRRGFEETTRVVMTPRGAVPTTAGSTPSRARSLPLDGVVADAGDMSVRVFIDAPEAADFGEGPSRPLPRRRRGEGPGRGADLPLGVRRGRGRHRAWRRLAE